MLSKSPLVSQKNIYWKVAEKEIIVEIMLPPEFDSKQIYPLLILNDGQDMAKMQMELILKEVWTKKICKPFILVAPHAIDRLDIYGVAGHPDYKGRGKKAASYTKFIIETLLPEVKKEIEVKEFEEIAIGGFSLGGLSALDIAWNQSELFKKVLVCSGSFWWRKRDLKNGYTDADRIMHSLVQATDAKPEIKIWLTCGTHDELSDRNHNGVIDSIDDTLDLVKELESMGFKTNEDLFYNEIIGGKHSLETYGIIIPYFLQWAFKP